MSPSAVVAWRDGEIEVATPGSEFVLRFARPDVLHVLHAFATPRTFEQALVDLPGWSRPDLVARTAALVDAGALCPVDEVREPPGSWDRWSFAFHRSTRSSHFKPRYAHRTAAVAPARSSRSVQLPIPGPWPEGRSLAETLSARQSRRRWAARSLSLDEVGHLLWQSARNRPTSHGLSRPYPSGGGVYSLEVYLVVDHDAVTDLATGIHRYRPESHELEEVSADPDVAEPFLLAAAGSAGSPAPPALIVITSRFARQSEIYSTLAYSLLLKEVGGLFQTLYLVAEDIGIAVCALGGGVPDELLGRWSRAGTGVEPIVGEMMLGPR